MERFSMVTKAIAVAAVAGGGTIAATADVVGGSGLVEALGRQAPALTMLVALVYMFLKHLKDSESSRVKAEKERDKMFASSIREVGEESHEMAVKTTGALDRNTEALGEMAGIISVLDLRARDSGDADDIRRRGNRG